jgi:dTMP kinase
MQYKFISFEGIEGCGKSSQTKILLERLTQKKINAIITREPGGSEASEAIREVLLSEKWPKLEPRTEIFLNFASRIEHIEKLIKPALNEGKVVISDRFFDSTLAYQGYGFGGDLKMIKQVNNLAIGDFCPDITFLIDAPVELTFSRIKNRKSNNRYEKLDTDFHLRVRDGFLQIAKENKRIKVIDGTKSIEEIADEIFELLNIA